LQGENFIPLIRLIVSPAVKSPKFLRLSSGVRIAEDFTLFHARRGGNALGDISLRDIFWLFFSVVRFFNLRNACKISSIPEFLTPILHAAYRPVD
jgi:hypothetical protein